MNPDFIELIQDALALVDEELEALEARGENTIYTDSLSEISSALGDALGEAKRWVVER